MAHSSPRLLAYLAYTYLGLVAYATLYPLSGWRDIGTPLLAFVVWEWPRYWTVTDLVFNSIAYLPLGFLLATLLANHLRPWLAALIAAVLVGLLSLGLETLQNWLPARDPAMLDLASNTLGGALGALLGWRWGWRWLTTLSRWQQHYLSGIPRAELGVLLALLWLACQLFPNAVPLGVGDVRYLLGLTNTQLFDPQRFQSMAAIVLASNFLAAGLLFSLLTHRPWQRYVLIAGLLALSILLRSIGQVWMAPKEAEGWFALHLFDWITPPFVQGSSVAASLLLLFMLLPGNLRAMLAGLSLLTATVLINLTPVDPYSRLASATGLPTLFFNVQNLAHGLAALWPFLALPYLLFVSRRG